MAQKSKARIERESEEAVLAQLSERGVIEVDHWLDWANGDPISIVGEAGVFTFLSVRVDKDGQPRWANVWGGPAKQEMMRSFPLEKLETFTKIKRRGKKKVAT